MLAFEIKLPTESYVTHFISDEKNMPSPTNEPHKEWSKKAISTNENNRNTRKIENCYFVLSRDEIFHQCDKWTDWSRTLSAQHNSKCCFHFRRKSYFHSPSSVVRWLWMSIKCHRDTCERAETHQWHKVESCDLCARALASFEFLRCTACT